MSTLLDALRLEQLDADRFRAPVVPTGLHRTYGGQVAAQAVAAAIRTVPGELAVHSLHSYFLREGDVEAPIDLVVDRVRDGRSFMTRQVAATQGGKTIFTLMASFQAATEGPQHQDPVPETLPPEQVVGGQDDFLRVVQGEWPDWDFVRVPGEPGAPRQQVWLRHRERLPDDPAVHACGLAYASDMTLLGCTRLPHRQERVQMASLDHAVWFLRPYRVDAWLLYDETSPSAGAGRALAHGRLFDQQGRMVASVVQEGLMRFLR